MHTGHVHKSDMGFQEPAMMSTWNWRRWSGVPPCSFNQIAGQCETYHEKMYTSCSPLPAAQSPFSSAGGAVGVVWALESSENATASYEWVNQNVSNNCLPDLDFCWWLRWTHRFGPWRLAWSRPHRQGRLPGAGRGAGRGGTWFWPKTPPKISQNTCN